MARPKSFNQEEVLEKAMHLFWDKGFEAASIQDLESHLGINRQSFYDTFGNKKQLFLKSLELYRAKGGDQLRLHFEGDQPVQQKFVAFFRFVIHASIHDNRGCFMANSTLELASHDEEVSKTVCNNLEDYEKAFEQILLEAQQKGEISSEQTSESLARYLFNSIQGIRVTAKATPDRVRLEDIAAITLSVLS